MNLRDFLKQNKIRPTKARISILGSIARLEKPTDAMSLLSSIRQKRLNIDRATVFRTLTLLLEKNIIRQIELNEGKFRYELASLPHHHHAVCVECKKVSAVDLGIIEEKFETLVAKSLSFQIQNHKLEFFGVCRNCQ